MNIVELNDRIDDFLKKYESELGKDVKALKNEHAIAKSEEWQRKLDEFDEQGRVLQIGIIGRVKAGKSSMLNALLFNGNDILPKAATPMTAALTIMEYSDTVRAEVEFFTQSDIDEIKRNHDIYLKELQKLTQSKLDEQITRKTKRKGLGIGTTNALTPEEQKECQDLAVKQASREMKNDATFASYDQYERIKQSGKSLTELEQYKIINAASVDELMNGALNKFVAADGEFMPYTKSVTLYIPEQGLQGLRIVDTPGINDPVTSREDRTYQLLQDCDVVLLVSPSGQFLSSEDTELLTRVTTKEGTQQAYIIASQADSQLFGSESAELTHPSDVTQRISMNLTAHAKNVLQKQAQDYPEMRVVADRLMKNNVICSSSVAFSMLQRFDAQDTWDSNLQHVWNNLNQKFPGVFGDRSLAKGALQQMANMDKLHQIIEEVRTNKKQIQAARKADFENSKRSALRDYLKAWEDRINAQIYHIENADVNELKNQQKDLESKQAEIQFKVGDIYSDLISEIKLDLNKQLNNKLKEEMRRYSQVADEAQGYQTESRTTREKRGGILGFIDFIDGGKRVTYTETYTTINATAIRRELESVRSNLQDELGYIAGVYTKEWKKKIYNQIVTELEKILGNGEFDIDMIVRTVKSVLAQIPEASFQIKDSLPKDLKKSGRLKGGEAEFYLSNAEEYVWSLQTTVKRDIDEYMKTLVTTLKQIDVAKELSSGLSEDLQKLVNEIQNKQASLYLYQGMKKELEMLKPE